MAKFARTKVRVEGFKELDKALSELPKATARNTLRRVLLKAGQPIADEASRLAPIGPTGRLKQGVQVSTKLRNPTGKAEFATVLKQGGTMEAARTALRNARRSAPGKSFAEVYVGPRSLPYSHLVEFGSVNNTPKPFMRPAWDAKKNVSLDIVKSDLGDEIMKSAKRVAKRQAKLAAK